MKKKAKILIILSVVLLVLGGGVLLLNSILNVQNTAAKVNGVRITKKQVQEQILYNQIHNGELLKFKSSLNQEESLSESEGKPEGYDEVLQYKIEAEVLRQSLGKQAVTRKEVQQTVKRYYHEMRVEQGDTDYNRFMKDKLSKFSMDEKEYFNLEEEHRYSQDNYKKAEALFLADWYLKNGDRQSEQAKQAEKAFEAHLQQLMEKADVQIADGEKTASAATAK